MVDANRRDRPRHTIRPTSLIADARGFAWEELRPCEPTPYLRLLKAAARLSAEPGSVSLPLVL
jgi:hypothetical protein